jgi:saccharopepsin
MCPLLTALISYFQYAMGWACGNVSYGSVEFLECVVCIKSVQSLSSLFSINVSSQAFIDASSVENPALSYGADGVLGFGFTQLSIIDSLLNRTHQSTGGNLLYNLFLDNVTEPNFIAVSLQRSTDINGVQGTFSIGILCIAYSRLDLMFV